MVGNAFQNGGRWILYHFFVKISLFYMHGNGVINNKVKYMNHHRKNLLPLIYHGRRFFYFIYPIMHCFYWNFVKRTCKSKFYITALKNRSHNSFSRFFYILLCQTFILFIDISLYICGYICLVVPVRKGDSTYIRL